MTSQMSTREKTLAALVGALVVIFATLVLGKKFTTHHRDLRQQLQEKTALLGGLQTLIGERDLWVQREAWLSSRQPRPEDATRAASKLLDEVLKPAAQRHSVLLENPQINAPVPRPPHYLSVNVQLETKSKWPDLIDFLCELQAPEKFVAIESAHLTLAGDKTQVIGKFRIAKWLALP